MKSTKNYSQTINELKKLLDNSEKIVVGAGAGLSTSAGFTYSGKRFEENFSDFEKKYGFTDMYSGGFYPYATLEQYWAFWSKNIYINRYNKKPLQTYTILFQLLKDKNYFVLTTNVDHQFQKAGFNKEKLFYTQGDYGLFQCSVPCHTKTYDNETVITEMYQEQKDMKIPAKLIPHCPVCKKPMTMNLRADNTFVEDDGWHKAAERYNRFIADTSDKKVLFLELGVGLNTPGIIKYPFWQLTYKNKNAKYVCINSSQIFIPQEIEKQSLVIEEDITKVLKSLQKVSLILS